MQRFAGFLAFWLLAGATWAAEPVLVVNNLTGSDTVASGAPASFGPFNASGTCHTNGAASTTIQWATNPLSGVPTDGSAVLWLATSSGRRSSKITGRAANTVTVADSFNIAAVSAVDCAVGGKRDSLSATRFTNDLKTGWEVQIETTGTDYAHTATLTFGGAAPLGNARTYIHGTLGQPRLVWSTDVTGLAVCGSCYFQNLYLQNTAGVKTAASTAFSWTSSAASVFRDSVFDGWFNAFAGSDGVFLFYNNEFKNAANSGAGTPATSQSTLMLANYVHDSPNGTGLGNIGITALYNLVVGVTAVGFKGIDLGSTSNHGTAIHNTVVGNDLGINYNGTGAGYTVVANLITSSGAVGLNATSGSGVYTIIRGRIINSNAYFGNLANYNNAVVGANDTTGVDPQYTNAGAADYSIGLGLVGLGWTPAALVNGISSTTATSTEPGASQRQGAGGGGGNWAY